jgi:hypothetical protein
MSITKCFSNINNPQVKALYEDKLAQGMTEDAAAAATIKEYAKSLNDRNNALRTKLKLPVMGGPNVDFLQEVIDNQYKDEDEQIEPEIEDFDDPTPTDEELNLVLDRQIKLVHKTASGRLHTSYRDALLDSNEGDEIQLGFEVSGEFNSIATTRKNTNRNSLQGFINNMIENDLLSDQKVWSRGEYVFEAEGNSDLRKGFTTAVIQTEVPAYLGKGGMTQDGFTFKFDDNLNKTTVLVFGDQLMEVDQRELDQMSYQELKDFYGTFTAIAQVSNREVDSRTPNYRNTPLNISDPGPAMTEETLQLRLMNLLNKMGVKVTTITEYNKKYKIRNGVNPNAKALADIANRVVAMAEGNLDSLSEEAAHFLNEAMPQEMVENVLRNIHKSEEWAQFSEIYREIYRDEYPESQLDAVVRREVLGKIVAKVLANPELQNEAGTETQRNFFRRVMDAIMEFAKSLSNMFKPQYKQELESYLNEVSKIALNEETAIELTTENFEHNTFRFYDIQDSGTAVGRLRRKSQALVRQLQDAERTLINAGVGLKANLNELNQVQEDLAKSLTINSLTSVTSMLDTSVKRLEKAIEASTKGADKDGKAPAYIFTQEENILFQFVKSVGRKGVEEIRELTGQALTKDEKNNKDYQMLKTSLDGLASRMAALETRATLFDSQNVRRMTQEIMDKYSIPESERALVEGWVDRAKKDTNLFHYAFGQLVHAQDGMLNLAGRVMRKMNVYGNTNFYRHTKRWQDKLKDLGVSEQELSKFVDNGYMVAPEDQAAFQRFLDSVFVQTYRKTMVGVPAGENTQGYQGGIEVMKAEIARLEALAARDEKYLEALQDQQKRLATIEELVLMTDEELIAKKRSGGLEPMTLQEETNRKNLERPYLVGGVDENGKVVDPAIVRAMEDSYYKEYEEKMAKAGVSPQTKQALSTIMSDIGRLKQKAYRRLENGRIILDFTQLSESDLMALRDSQTSRKALKSYVDKTGALKPGLLFKETNGRVETDERGEPIVVIADPSKLTQASMAAIELHKLDEQFDKGAEEKASQLFFEILDEIDRKDGREAALKFLEVNAFTTFRKDFWDNLGSGNSLVNRLKAVQPKDALDEKNINDLVFKIVGLSFEIKNILRQYHKKNNPAEVDVDLMDPVTLDRIKDLQGQLQDKLSQANSRINQEEKIQDENEERDEELAFGVSDVNQAYRDELKNQDILENEADSTEYNLAKAENEVEFASKHMTAYSAAGLQKAKADLRKYVNGMTTRLSKPVETVLEDLGRDPQDLVGNAELQAQVLRIMTRKRVLPYFKRFAPAAYSEFTDGLNEAKRGELSNYLQGQKAQDAFVAIDPNYSFFDSTENEKVNAAYDTNYDGGYLQPVKERFKSAKFQELFGEIVDGKSTKDDRLYQAYLATREYYKEALKAMNVGENYNTYKVPQIRRRSVERMSNLLTAKGRGNIKNLWKEAVTFTEDEMIQGEEVYGSDIKVIPKMYTRDLQNPEDLSSDLFTALTMFGKEAYMREAKIKYYGDIMSIQDKILTRDMNGKDPSKSNTYKMFKSAVDYNLFGIKESVTHEIRTPFGSMDIAKLGRNLLHYVKLRNLGLNIIIPVTSAITGDVTRKIEAYIGEYVDLKSQRKGAREFAKLAPDGMKEIGKIDQRAKINALGQFYNAFNLQDSFDNSSYSNLLRAIPRTAMFLHTAANYPLYGKTMLGILHDFKVVDGQVMDRNQFKNMKKAEGLTTASIKKDWEDERHRPLYEYITHDGNSVDYNRKALMNDLMLEGRKPSEQELEGIIDELHSNVQGKIQFVNSIIDGQIPEDDRVYAQRHFLLSYLMTHRGWLSIAISRRTKGRHLNFDTQTMEEGSYRSMVNYFGNWIREFSDEGLKNFVTGWVKV